MARNHARPLSPHLQVWKWQIHFFVSIFNRMMGAGLATVGAALLVWWLVALSGGEAAYATFITFMKSWYGMIFPIGLSFAFFFHLCAGLRHFVMDSGAGFELDTNRNWAWGALIDAFVLTGAMWLLIFARMI